MTAGYSRATEAAVLIPLHGHHTDIPTGSVLLSPLTPEGEMMSRDGLVAFITHTQEGSFCEDEFHATSSRTALRMRNLPYPGAYRFCDPSTIQIGAIYDLTREVINHVVNPGSFEHWFDVDVLDVLPDRKTCGSMSLSDVHYLHCSGGRLFSDSPMIFQSWNGQIIIRSAPGERAIIYDHTAAELRQMLDKHEIEPRIMSRLCGSVT